MSSDTLCDEASTLFAWIGDKDLKAAGCDRGLEPSGELGPIGRVVATRHLKQVILLDDRDSEGRGRCYQDWLRGECGAGVEVKYESARVNGPTSLDGIYRKANTIVGESGVLSPLFLISSGTSAMGFVWVLLASRYNATLLESSTQEGVSDVIVPLPDYESVLLPGLRTAHEATGVARPQLLFAWLGGSDRGARDGERVGPVAGFLSLHPHSEIVLLYEQNDRSLEKSELYCGWLQARLGEVAAVHGEPVHLADKTFRTIHAETLKVVQRWRMQRHDPGMTFLVSSGMTAMRIAWHLISTTYLRAELWETFEQQGQERANRVAWPLL